MQVYLRQLTESGLQRMHSWLDEVTQHPKVPEELMRDPALAPPLPGDPHVAVEVFPTRLSFAVWADDVLAMPGLERFQLDIGFWAWLTAALFDQVCPLRPDGTRPAGQRARYVPDFSDWRRYYRHLLAGPWSIYQAHRDAPQNVMAVLCGALDRPGDVVEQLASRQELVSNPAVMSLATRLYYDGRRGSLKKGAGSKGKGSPRRLAGVLDQFDVTYDLYSLTADELATLLPAEFRRE